MKTSNELELQGCAGLRGQQGQAFLNAAQYPSDCGCKQETIQLGCALNENVHNPKIL